MRNVNNTGALNNNNANNALGFAPDWGNRSFKVSYTPKSMHLPQGIAAPAETKVEVKCGALTLLASNAIAAISGAFFL